MPILLATRYAQLLAGIGSTAAFLWFRHAWCSSIARCAPRLQRKTLCIRLEPSTFSKVFVIRRAEFSGGPGESHPAAALAYPYAVEHDGHLYVAYSNNGGNVGRSGTGRQLWNNNSAELAVIPIAQLR